MTEHLSANGGESPQTPAATPALFAGRRRPETTLTPATPLFRQVTPTVDADASIPVDFTKRKELLTTGVTSPSDYGDSSPANGEEPPTQTSTIPPVDRRRDTSRGSQIRSSSSGGTKKRARPALSAGTARRRDDPKGGNSETRDPSSSGGTRQAAQAATSAQATAVNHAALICLGGFFHSVSQVLWFINRALESAEVSAEDKAGLSAPDFATQVAALKLVFARQVLRGSRRGTGVSVKEALEAIVRAELELDEKRENYAADVLRVKAQRAKKAASE